MVLVKNEKEIIMSLVTDVFMWLIIDTVIGFALYSTGAVILKVLSFGQYQAEFKDFASFKKADSKKVTLVIVLGLFFYILLISLLTLFSG